MVATGVGFDIESKCCDFSNKVKSADVRHKATSPYTAAQGDETFNASDTGKHFSMSQSVVQLIFLYSFHMI